MKKKIQAIPYRIVNGRVLYFVGKRPDSTYLQPITGCVGWEIPKETLVEALRRELEEEIGVKHFCNLINPKFSYTFKTARIKFSNGRPVREHVFGVEVSDQKITLDKNEFASFEFVSYDKALAQYSFPNQKHALALVNATISSHSYPKIFTISGPGASGKETIIEEILGKIKNIERAKTCNTRAVRKNEKKPKKGRIFLTEEKFKLLERSGDLIESNFFNGHWYGTPWSEIERINEKGRDVIIEVDLNGVKSLKSKFTNVISTFIETSLADLKKRFILRAQDSPKVIEARLRIAQREIAESKVCDHIVKNKQGELEKTVDAVVKIIKQNRRDNEK